MSEQDYEKVKFVQYIPKNHHGEPENAINSLYIESQIENSDEVSHIIPQQPITDGNRQSDRRCKSQHINRRCANKKELDIAEVEN